MWLVLDVEIGRWVGPGYEVLTVSCERAGRAVPLNLMLDSRSTLEMFPLETVQIKQKTFQMVVVGVAISLCADRTAL
eukprot:5709721-Amphidinium_carterae.1